jgi:transcription antitermination factor NusG
LLEIFVPVEHYKDKRGSYTYCLIDGYAFVRGPYQDRDYFRLEDSQYVQKVLTYPKGSMRAVFYTHDGKIVTMREQLRSMVPSGFAANDPVSIIGGLYSGLKGKFVTEIDASNALVEVLMPLGSLTKLTSIPKVFLSKES